MTDPRAAIFASVAKAQAGFTPVTGEPVLVGTRQAFVGAVGPSGVTLRYEDGMEETLPLVAVRGRAVARLQLRSPDAKPPAFMTIAKRLAVATSVPADMRVAQLARLAARAPSIEDAVAVRELALKLGGAQ